MPIPLPPIEDGFVTFPDPSAPSFVSAYEMTAYGTPATITSGSSDHCVIPVTGARPIASIVSVSSVHVIDDEIGAGLAVATASVVSSSSVHEMVAKSSGG